MKKTLKSKTTWTVGGSAGSIAALIALLRNTSGLPWPEEQDAEVIGVLMTLLVPLLGRVVAWLRGRLG